ncbi:MAG: ATP-binding protein [Candidatus Tenebribacter davisii]|nr:ATP-binding protein [Candidatus Tenebribacter davisii]
MEDTWHAETKDRLATNEIYKELKVKCNNDSSGAQVISLVDDATYYAYQRTKLVIRHMGEFTLHDGDHLFQVLRIMELLIGVQNITSLSIPELALLIISAFFHDLGMAPSEFEVIAWKKFWDTTPLFDSEAEEVQYNAFKRHVLARPDRLKIINDLVIENEISKADIQKSYLIADYIRETHSLRAKEIIQQDWGNKLKYKDTDFSLELAEICYSHNEDPLSLLNLDMHYLFGQGQFACLPLIGVILRIADILDFDPKRTPDILLSSLNIKNPVSLIEWKKHRSIESWIINSDFIQFHAKCRHPAIEYSIRLFCDLIDKELSTCNNVLTKINQYNSLNKIGYNISLPFKVDRTKIVTKKDIYGKPEYIFRETKFNLSKNQVIDLLMGTKLYGDPEVALRELLQNSIDACLLRQAMEKNWNNAYVPKLLVKYIKVEDEDILIVEDNGIGMDQEIIDKYYTRIGTSFYKSADFYDLKAESKADFQPTSRFGIGILSCFMVSDTLIVDTRKVYAPHSSSEPINLTVEGQDSIFWIKQGERTIPGTTTKLVLRKNRNPWDKITGEQFIHSVENVIPNPPFEISIDCEGKEIIRNENSFYELSANSLKNHNWNDNENIREIEFNIDDRINGIIGSVVVALLESQNRPKTTIGIQTKTIEIDGQSYDLDKSISMNNNEIELHSTSITIDDEGNIDSSSGYSKLAKSQSRISLHGIEIPTTLFPETWRLQKNQVRLSWPFPMLIVVDICAQRDLDLNSSRNQILFGDRWIEFEEKLAQKVCENIRSKVGNKYWEELKPLLIEKSNSEQFLIAINSID